MKEYYNHVALWIKANKPKYVLVRIHYHNDPRGEYYWSLKNTDYVDRVNDILWIGSREFEEYINELSKVSTMKFFIFKEPGKKKEI